MKILDAFIKWLQCKRGSKTYENHFKRIKLTKNNYANKSTGKRIVFLERVYKFNDNLGKFLLGVKTPQYQRKERF